MSFTALDNYMAGSGYYSVEDDGVIDDIKKCEQVVYTAVDTNEAEIEICFEITIDCGEDEAENAFYLRVNDIDDINNINQKRGTKTVISLIDQVVEMGFSRENALRGIDASLDEEYGFIEREAIGLTNERIPESFYNDILYAFKCEKEGMEK